MHRLARPGRAAADCLPGMGHSLLLTARHPGLRLLCHMASQTYSSATLKLGMSVKAVSALTVVHTAIHLTQLSTGQCTALDPDSRWYGRVDSRYSRAILCCCTLFRSALDCAYLRWYRRFVSLTTACQACFKPFGVAPTDIYPPGGVSPLAASHDWQLLVSGGSLTHGIIGFQSLFSMPVGQDRPFCWLAHCVVIRTNLCTAVLTNR